MKKTSIIIGADLVPTKSNLKMFCDASVDKIFGKELIDILDSSDIKVFNLECPLIDYESPIKKCGPVLGINKDVIKGIKEINPSCLCLANNHIMDHGSEGLKSTIDTLEKNNIEYCGVGNNINSLHTNWVANVGNLKICVYACAEHEFSIANEDTPGANPFNVLKVYEEINQLSKINDFVIVLYHGGKEFYPYPSPNLQNYCRKFIDYGADFVVCQHSHCIGSKELYNNKYIIYGQGNFIFDDGTNSYDWNHGLLIDLSISKKHSVDSICYHVLERKDNVVRLADEQESNIIINNFEKRSKEISNNNFVKNNYSQFCEENLYNLLRKFDLIGNSIVFRALNKFTKQKFGKFYFKKIYLRKKSYDLQNVLECEAWNELALTGIKKYNEIENKR